MVDQRVLVPPAVHQQTVSTTTLISMIFGAQASLMKAMFTCESGLRQFNDDGSLLVSRTEDLGIAQINLIWWDKAAELGYDITTLYGNLMFAKYILDTQGLGAWSCAPKVVHNYPKL